MAKFTPELNEEINRTLRNFNSKVRRNKTKTRGKGMLPYTVSVKQFKLRYSDKPVKEIKRQLKLYQAFAERDAMDKPYENRISKWERDYFKANRKKTIEFYDNEIDDYMRIIGGRPEFHLRLNERLNDLMEQRKELEIPLEKLTEDQIKGMRAYYHYAERSELAKAQGFRLYFAQLERLMKNLGYKKSERDALFEKFNQLSENEFTEMVRREDVVDDIYTQVISPKGRGVYELARDEEDAIKAVEDLINEADALVAKYKTTK